MKFTRLFTGPDGDSHFEDGTIPLSDSGYAGQRSEPIKAKAITFVELSGSYKYGWHNAPCRQFVITLENEGEYEASDGTKRRFGPGDILLCEDITGRGHISRGVNDRPRRTVVVALD